MRLSIVVLGLIVVLAGGLVLPSGASQGQQVTTTTTSQTSTGTCPQGYSWLNGVCIQSYTTSTASSVSTTQQTTSTTPAQTTRTFVTLTVRVTPQPSSAQTGQQVTFTVTISGGSGTYPVVVVNFGDGTEASPASSGSTQTVSHAYLNPGTYTVAVSAADNMADSGSGTTTISISPSTPPPSGQIQIQFTIISSYDNTPIQGASVIMKNTQTGGSYGPQTTNSGGQTTFTIPSGSYTVTFSAFDYKPYTQNYIFSQSAGINVALLLTCGGCLSVFGATIDGTTAWSIIGIGLFVVVVGAVLPGGKREPKKK